MRPIRYIPPVGALVEVTCRTIHGRFLLLPSRRLNEIVVGVLARAKRLYGPEVCAAAFLSNHYHLLLHVRDAKQLADFMRYVNSNLAREVARLTGWQHRIWARRYQAILISEEPTAQIARFRYILAHGVKENLVARVGEWPGVHCAEALMNGHELAGWWFDRSKEWAARNRREDFSVYTYAESEALSFDPLPCWRGQSREMRQAFVCDLVEQVESEAADMRQRNGIEPLGLQAILCQRPTEQPLEPKQSPAPDFHAATKRARLAMREAYATVVSVFREASARLRNGVRPVAFPDGTFPPALPFQYADLASQPP